MDRKLKTSIITGVLLAEGVGVLSSILAGNISCVYNNLLQPPLSPPGWVFPIVWIILYALMGIAAAMVSQSRNIRPEEKGQALALYALQLFVNFWWPIFFFRGQYFFVALLVLLLLDVLVLLATASFYKVEPAAAALMVPYLVWILFATYLNFGVAVLN